MTRHVAVVGAGWSGLACALTLVEQGARVTLIDAARAAGGRARRVDFALGDATFPLDNGQHLLLGACCETLRLIERVGLDPAALLLRMPFELRYADGFALRANDWPAPWHLAAALAGARGFSLAARVSIARDVLAWRRGGWRAEAAASARSALRFATPEAVRRVWNPLCLAALNVALESASAQIFLNLLRESLGADARASDLLLPRADLSALFPDAALRALQRLGATTRLQARVVALRAAARWTLECGNETLDADGVVLALPPARAVALLASVADNALASAIGELQRIETAAIATVYLRYPPGALLPAPMLALRDDPTAGRYGQWAFDRGALDPRCAGVLAVVISGDGPHLALERDALAGAVARQLSDALALPAPCAHYAIVEKRATIVPRPGLRRPPARLAAEGLFLAGDAADSDYPSTLEGSVRAGIAAAQAALSF